MKVFLPLLVLICNICVAQNVLPNFPTVKTFSSPLDNAESGDINADVTSATKQQKTVSDSTKNGADFALRKVTTVRSPLDADFNRNAFSSSEDAIASERDLLGDLESMSSCEKDCSKSLMETLGLVLKTMSHVERYRQICEHYEIAHRCITEERKCHEIRHEKEETNISFEVFSSGLKYMCVDQALAFNSTIHCIDSEAGRVQTECEAECQTKNIVMNWIMRSSIVQGIQEGISGLQAGNPLDPSFGSMGKTPSLSDSLANNPQMMDNLRQMSNDLCKVGDCVLRCLKSKFNARCEGVAGTLLAEVFVRPIASGQEKMSMIAPFLGMIIPQQCNYLYSANELEKHRIDPSLDSELRRMYRDKEAESSKGKIQPTTDDPSIAQLFKLPTVPSPFDGKTHINSLVEALYRQSNKTDFDVANMREELNEDDLLDIAPTSTTVSVHLSDATNKTYGRIPSSNVLFYAPKRSGTLRCSLRKM